ncbi:hypothetical protein KZO37_15480 [Rhodococcus fascians]|nr:hypothetical protein [Rhodococcus fascians]
MSEARHCADPEIHHNRWLGQRCRHLGLLNIPTPVFSISSFLNACNSLFFAAAVLAMREACEDGMSQKMLLNELRSGDGRPARPRHSLDL